jgi:hypothetical protein|tara:strand:+ start:63 stop:542 length:480 start_codon:yes stop_codon:yes gene_type:complete
MNEMKSSRKQAAKEKQVTRLKSSAKTVDQIEWRRNTGNPIIDTFTVYDDSVGGYITIEDYEFEVRMPLRKLIRQFEKLSNRYDNKTKKVNITNEEGYMLNETQELIIKDMIPDFDVDSDDIRIDSTLYNQIASFCWEFYRFFGRKSTEAQSELFGTEGV